MAHMKSLAQRTVWVKFHLLTGAVLKIWFKEPSLVEMPKPGSSELVFVTSLSEWAIAHVSQLRVMSGKVVNTLGIGGI